MNKLKNKIRGSIIFKSFIVTALGSGLSKGLMILGTFYCTHALSKSAFGEYSFIRNTLTMILTICAVNFSSLCTKYATEVKSSLSSLHRMLLLFIFSFVMCLLAGILLLVLPQDFLKGIFGSYKIVDFFRLVALFLPIFMLQPLLEGILRGLMQFKLIGILQTISSLFYIVTLILGVEIAGLNGAVIGLYIFYFVYSTVSAIIVFKLEPPSKYFRKFKGASHEYKAIFKMILPVFIMSFVEAPIFWVLQVMLTRYSTIDSVGSMTVMKQLRNFATLIPNYFFNTYIAFAGALTAEKKYREYFAQFDKLLKWFLYLGLVMFVAFSLSSKWLLFLYGKEYMDDWFCLIICCIGIPIGLVTTLIRQSLILQEHQQQLMYFSIVWNVLWIVLFYVFVQLGVDSLLAFFYSEIISWFINLVLSYRLYNLDKKKFLYL